MKLTGTGGGRMKLRNVIIKVDSLEDTMNRFVEVYEKVRKKEKVEPQEILSFVNAKLMRQTLTPQRLRLMKIIREKEPKTIYELAKVAKRSYANVFRDVKKLRELELIDLKQEKNSSKPMAKYDRLDVSIPV